MQVIAVILSIGLLIGYNASLLIQPRTNPWPAYWSALVAQRTTPEMQEPEKHELVIDQPVTSFLVPGQSPMKCPDCGTASVSLTIWDGVFAAPDGGKVTARALQGWTCSGCGWKHIDESQVRFNERRIARTLAGHKS